MNRIVRFAMVVFVTSCCIAAILSQTLQSAATIPNSAIASPTRVDVAQISAAQTSAAQNIDFAQHFRELGVEGSILIYDLNSDRVFQHNPQRNTTAFLPASTFKILGVA